MERWSWTVGKLAGIDVRVHATFPLLLPWVVWHTLSAGGTMTDAIQAIGLVLVLFAVVVLHELGHALAARRYGIGTRDIILLPIGGVARLERMPKKPFPQLMVALAGPAVNAVLAIAFMGAAWAVHGWWAMGPMGVQMGLALPTLGWINIVLGAFNMLPAYPMDGGRALRALLAMVIRDGRATWIAARIGQVLGAGFVFVGLSTNPMLVVIGLFVLVGAGVELNSVRICELLEGITVGDTMATDVKLVIDHTPLSVAAEAIAHGFQQELPVVGIDGQLRGVLTHQDVARGLAAHGPSSPVRRVLRPGPDPVSPEQPLVDVLSRLSSNARGVPVVSSTGQVVGLLTGRKAGQILTLRQAGIKLPHHLGEDVSSADDNPRHDAERPVRQTGPG